MDQNQGLPINAQHVSQQFQRRAGLADSRFLLDEIAQRMKQRLGYIKIKPEVLVDAGCGPALRTRDLSEQYPDCRIIGIDSNPDAIEQARQETKKGVLPRLLSQLKGNSKSKYEFAHKDAASTGLPPQSVDLIWSNLMLHWHPNPALVVAEWQRLLKRQGLVMFSYFAPFTCIELRQALAQTSWQTQTMPFVDMHDLGDILLENGFADPVMDQELLTLTYDTTEKLLSDVHALGGNAAAGRNPGLMGKGVYRELKEALDQQRNPQDGLIHLSFEVAYGHAWRGDSLKKGQETLISVDSIFKKKNSNT